jgi:hypothetical protein
MSTLKPTFAIILSYALAVTPTFGQTESSTEDRTEESETPRESEAETSESSQKTETQPEAAPESSDAQPSDKSNEPVEKKKKKKVVQDEPGAPPRGTGKLVGGIVTASVGTGIGLLSLLAATIDCNDIDKDDANSTDEAKKKEREKSVKDCNDQKPQIRALGGVFLVAGLVVGLPLIYFGVQDRKVYNEWKSTQPAQDESASAPGKASIVFLPNGESFSPGINVTYNF